MPSRTLVISDTHLGRGRLSVLDPAHLEELLRAVDHLVINGDTAEIHHPRHSREAAFALDRLRELAERCGTRLDLVNGNHDPDVGQAHYLQLREGRIFITHGHVLHPSIAPWSPNASVLESAYKQQVEDSRASTMDEMFDALARASLKEWANVSMDLSKTGNRAILVRPRSVFNVVKYWWTMPALVDAFVSEYVPATRIVLVGHSHHAGHYSRNGRDIINTGCFGFPGRPLGALLEADVLSTHPIRFEADRWILREHRTHGRYDLRDQESGKSPAVTGTPPEDDQSSLADTSRAASATSSGSMPDSMPLSRHS